MTKRKRLIKTVKLKLLTALLLMITSSSFSQYFDDDDFGDKKTVSNYGRITKLSPFALFYGSMPLTGEYGLSFEQKTGLKTSFQGDIAYLGNGLLYLMVFASDTTNSDRLKMSGFRAQASFRYYLGKKQACNGWYIAPHVSFARCRYTDASSKQSGYYLQGTHIDYSAILGRQFVWGRFVMDLNFGITYRDRIWFEKNYNSAQTLNRKDFEDLYMIPGSVRPRIGFSLGRTF
jgi:hypothetical protein